MQRIFFIIFIIVSLVADSFITKEEYARMLYKNPRGIGCNKCHGNNGKGLILGRYKDKKGKTITIKAPDITTLSFEKFKSALIGTKHRLMPHYFLTVKEIRVLYYYLHRKKQ